MNPNKSAHPLRYKKLNQINNVAGKQTGGLSLRNVTCDFSLRIGEVREVTGSILNTPALRKCKHHISTAWLTERFSKCRGRQSQWISCAASWGAALLFVSHEARGPQRVRWTSHAYWGRQGVFTWIFPSLCQKRKGGFKRLFPSFLPFFSAI